MAQIGSLFVRLGMDAGEFKKGLSASEGALQSFGNRAQSIGRQLTLSLTAPLVALGTAAVMAFNNQEQALAGVEAAVRSTGGAAGFTTQQLADMADKLQAISTFDDDDILSKLTGNLLTFTNVAGPVFEQAQQAALDLSARLGQDLQTSAIQLGKALNDPIRGITALSRVGVSFTEVQKEQIKAFVEGGQVAKAQGIILAELRKEFGGQATAMANTTQGQLVQACMALDDAMKKVGAAIAPVLVPFAQAVKSLAGAFSELSPETNRFIVTLGALTAAAGPALVAIGLLATGLAAVSAPVMLTVGGLGLLTAAVAAFWPQLQQLARMASTAFSDVYTTAKKWLFDALSPIINAVSSAFEKLASVFRFLRQALGIDAVLNGISSMMGGVASTVQSGLDAVHKAWVDAGLKTVEAAPALAAQLASPAVEASKLVAAAQLAVQGGLTGTMEGMKQHAGEMQQLGEQITESMRTPLEEMIAKLDQLDNVFKAKAISAQAYGDAQARAAFVASSAYAGMAGDIANNLTKVFGNSKVVAIASAIVNTAESVTKTLATYGATPWGFAAAAAAAAAGAAQIAAIRKQTASGGGSAPSAGPSGASSGGLGSTAAAPAQQSLSRSMTIQPVDRAALYSGAVIEAIVGNINEYVKDGGYMISTELRPA